MCEAVAFGGQAGPPGAYLDRVFDRATQRYLMPVSRDRAIAALHARGLTGRGVSMAIVDTGVWSAHPSIRRALAAADDVTGEGPEDENGHGTEVALVALATAPDQQIYSVKALNREAIGTRDTLVAGIRRAYATAARMVNLSAGVYDGDCAGDCPLCSLAGEARAHGKLLFAAAGNRRGVTACPAKFAVAHPDEARGVGVFGIGAFDADRGAVAANSGIGTMLGDVGTYDLRPVDATGR